MFLHRCFSHTCRFTCYGSVWEKNRRFIDKGLTSTLLYRVWTFVKVTNVYLCLFVSFGGLKKLGRNMLSAKLQQHKSHLSSSELFLQDRSLASNLLFPTLTLRFFLFYFSWFLGTKFGRASRLTDTSPFSRYWAFCIFSLKEGQRTKNASIRRMLVSTSRQKWMRDAGRFIFWYIPTSQRPITIWPIWTLQRFMTNKDTWCILLLLLWTRALKFQAENEKSPDQWERFRLIK